MPRLQSVRCRLVAASEGSTPPKRHEFAERELPPDSSELLSAVIEGPSERGLPPCSSDSLWAGKRTAARRWLQSVRCRLIAARIGAEIAGCGCREWAAAL